MTYAYATATKRSLYTFLPSSRSSVPKLVARGGREGGAGKTTSNGVQLNCMDGIPCFTASFKFKC